MKKILLFVCGHNAGRSQMAEAYFNYKNTNSNYQALSAGTKPADQVNPNAIKVLEAEGIDTANLEPKMLNDEMLESAEKIYTMGCGVEEACLYGAEYTDLQLEDPHGLDIEGVARVFQEVKKAVDQIINQLPS